jgi:amino acid transporter
VRVGLSFVAGWTATTGWIALVAANAIMTSNFVMGIIALMHPTFESRPYQIFLLYLGMTLLAYLLNTFAVRLLPWLDTGAMVWSMLGIVTVMITLLACASGSYQPAKAVFATWTNTTGWPDGMAFMLALLQSVLGFTAFDAVSHLSEEMPRPSVNAPKAMVIAVLIGSVTGWLFLVILLLCLKDLDAATGAATGPLIEIYRQVTGSNAGTTCLVMFNLFAMFFACQGACTVASRLLMTFGRDNGMAGLSRYLGAVHPRLLVPQWSVMFVAVVVVIFGLINLGSSVALNAIISSAIVFLQVSYFIPSKQLTQCAAHPSLLHVPARRGRVRRRPPLLVAREVAPARQRPRARVPHRHDRVLLLPAGRARHGQQHVVRRRCVRHRHAPRPRGVGHERAQGVLRPERDGGEAGRGAADVSDRREDGKRGCVAGL